METLKISDLSVGDWVYYDDRICQIAEIYHLTYNIGSKKMTSFPSVTLFYEDDMPTYQESVILKDIHPIPITAEVLEKNGFVDNCGRWYNSEVIMEFEQDRDGWWRTINCGEYSVYFINYVHQLQHALRLAGVDKEINL